MKSVSRTQQVLNVYGVILILWSVYRWKLAMPEWFDELLAKPFIFVLPVYWYITHRENKSFLQDIWLHTKKLSGDMYIGLSIGAVFIISAFFVQYIKHSQFAIDFLMSRGFIVGVVLAFATALSEEILSRGFILKKFYEESKNIYLSAFNASVLFIILHIPILFTIPDLRGTLLIIVLMTDFTLSLINSFIFLDRKSLLAPILIHAIYNIAILMY